jgi:hypothetical protein
MIDPLQAARRILIVFTGYLAGRKVMFRPRWLTAFVAIAAVFVLMTADAHARAGGGFSGG